MSTITLRGLSIHFMDSRMLEYADFKTAGRSPIEGFSPTSSLLRVSFRYFVRIVATTKPVTVAIPQHRRKAWTMPASPPPYAFIIQPPM